MRTVAVAYVTLLLGIVALADLGALGPVLRLVHAVPWMDKLAHLGFAIVLGLVTEAASRSKGRASAVVAMVVLVEELSQRIVPGRTFDLLDLAADGVGLALGTAIAWLARRRSHTGDEPAARSS